MRIITPKEHENQPLDEVMQHKGRRHCHHLPLNERLHVMTVVYNPYRYRTRYKHYWPFRRMVHESGAVLWTVEIAQRNRPFEVTQADDPFDLQLRTPEIIWHKERALNLLFRYITNYGCPGAQNFAWVDADVTFQDPRWVEETLQWLQHYKVLQMFSHSLDLDPHYQPVMDKHGVPNVQTGFMYQYVRSVRDNDATRPHRVNTKTGGRYPYHGHRLWHPGYAWAARRSAINDLGGFGDIAILGSGDHHMACALINEVDTSIHNQMDATFKDYWHTWQDRANRHVHGNVGYMPGLITHAWHGPKRKRGYVDRWQILTQNEYNYLHDVNEDAQGLYQLAGNKPRMAAQIKEYFRQRDEDDIRVD